MKKLAKKTPSQLAKEQAVLDIRAELSKYGKSYIRTSMRQLKTFNSYCLSGWTFEAKED